MTKYVLNSGGFRDKPDLAKKYFAEIVDGLGSNPRLLVCFFAQPREEWEKRFAYDLKSIPKFIPREVTPRLELAFPATFERQVRDSDAVFIHGGDDNLVMYRLGKFDIPKIWKDKVVATSSAGSHAISKYFWTCDWRQCMDGLGILPIKFLAHYNSRYGNDDPRGPINWRHALRDLKSYKDSKLPIHALEEGEYVVIKK